MLGSKDGRDPTAAASLCGGCRCGCRASRLAQRERQHGRDRDRSALRCVGSWDVLGRPHAPLSAVVEHHLRVVDLRTAARATVSPDPPSLLLLSATSCCGCWHAEGCTLPLRDQQPILATAFFQLLVRVGVARIVTFRTCNAVWYAWKRTVTVSPACFFVSLGDSLRVVQTAHP